MSFCCRGLLRLGASVVSVTLAVSPSIAQETTPAAESMQPSAAQLPAVVVTTTPKAHKKKVAGKHKASKRKNVAKVTASPTTPPPKPTVEEVAAEQTAVAEKAWMTTGNPSPTKTLGNLPPAYAGGQVATGGGLGMLGNRSTMDTPFSQTSYTAKTMQDQQARTVGDVLANDSSVRSVLGASAGYGFDVYNIRGFYYENGDSALNGLYGLAPQYSTDPNFVERVEVLKGPNALLSGMPPAGAVGGSINLVTKQATDVPITQVTTSYQSDGYFGTQLDYGRRYGANKEFGVRFNGGYSGGDTSIDGQSEELGNAVLNLDYRGDRLRLSADVGYQRENLDSPLRFLTFNPAAAALFLQRPFTEVPPAPSAGSNYGVPWSYWKPSDTFAMVQGEFDITKNITAYGAYGWHGSGIDFRYPSPTVYNSDGDWVARPIAGGEDIDTWSGLAGVRTNINTGPVKHLVNVSYSSVKRDDDGNFAGATGPTCIPPPVSSIPVYSSGFVCSNLYNPADVPVPSFGPSSRTLTKTDLSSVGVSDTLSILNDRIQVTVGVRHQTASSETLTSSTGDSVWSPAYAVLLKPWNNVSLYANYIEGLKMGQTVPIDGTYVNGGEVFPPYKTEQKEVGVKVDFGRISTTFAAFDITQPSFITSGIAPNARLDLDGEQRNQGIELNAFGELTPGIRVLGGVTLLDGRLTKTQNGANDGNKAQGVANWNVNMGAEWDTPFIQGLTLTGRVIYTSDTYINAANTLSIPDWTRVDLGGRYTFKSPWTGKPMTVRFEVENVANESYYAGSYSADGIVSVGAPRTYLVSSTVNF